MSSTDIAIWAALYSSQVALQGAAAQGAQAGAMGCADSIVDGLAVLALAAVMIAAIYFNRGSR